MIFLRKQRVGQWDGCNHPELGSLHQHHVHGHPPADHWRNHILCVVCAAGAGARLLILDGMLWQNRTELTGATLMLVRIHTSTPHSAIHGRCLVQNQTFQTRINKCLYLASFGCNATMPMTTGGVTIVMWSSSTWRMLVKRLSLVLVDLAEHLYLCGLVYCQTVRLQSS